MAERRGMHGIRQREGAEAVPELPGDAWSGTGAGAGLGRRGNGSQRRRCCAAERTKEGEGGGDPWVLSAVTGTTRTSL
jgi:hypothetical protein